MPFLCDLGWHRPEPVARWNSGYYFARCARCGQDLVRTAYGRWHVPHGYRVVWQAQAPANAVSAALVEEPAAPDPATAPEELPIQEVLRHLQNGDGPARADPRGAPPEELISRAVPAPRIADFMNEATGPGAWESAERHYLLRPVAPAERHQGQADEVDDGPGPLERLRARLAALAVLVARDRGDAPVEPVADSAAPAGRPSNMRLALIAFVPAMLLLVALLLWGGGESGRPAEAGGNAAQVALGVPGSGQPAFVTASVLNCRSAPALEADPVSVLMRGDPVRLLARDAEWVSLVHEGGQCWALARYFSIEQPI